MECVYCAVRTLPINIIQDNASFSGRAVALTNGRWHTCTTTTTTTTTNNNNNNKVKYEKSAFSSRPLTIEAWARSQIIPTEICGQQRGSGTGFSPSVFDFTCQYRCTNAPYSSPSAGCSCQKTKSANIPKSNAPSKIVQHLTGKYFHFL
jgi:hypothetical protein